MDTKNYLDGEITRLYTRMTELEPDSEEYADVEEKYNKLMTLKLEFEKHNADKKDRVGKYVIEGVKVFVPLAVSVGMTFLLTACEAKGVVPFGIGKKWADKITKY